ncbi:hypothetical protein HDU87_000114 [Geranomyces variabilis]|uniref:Uncharacterized protein n=1 Tax=Geranomyces variabilis TaxID=109894 RepID=A0AAD5TS12_9FUNG|nr:hypothetical protein HDU87_000114 [Geranomyces variabilis]
MKSPVTAFALSLLALLSSSALADPVFSYEPTYVVGKTYTLTVDFGIMDPVPPGNLTFAYGPAPSAQSLVSPLPLLTQFTDIGPANPIPGSGSATKRGTQWTPDAAALSRYSAGQKFLLAVHGAEKAANGSPQLWGYWKVAQQNFTITTTTGTMTTAAGGASASVTSITIATATPVAGSGTVVVASTSAASASAAATATGSAASGQVASGAVGAAAVGSAAIMVAGSLGMLVAAM